jgi:hypothetical protein
MQISYTDSIMVSLKSTFPPSGKQENLRRNFSVFSFVKIPIALRFFNKVGIVLCSYCGTPVTFKRLEY